MQLDVERNLHQLSESIKLKQALDQINPEKETNTIQPGSLVTTSEGNFYLAISVGQVVLNGESYFILSPTSPLGLKLVQAATAGSSFAFNEKTYKIESVI